MNKYIVLGLTVVPPLLAAYFLLYFLFNGSSGNGLFLMYGFNLCVAVYLFVIIGFLTNAALRDDIDEKQKSVWFLLMTCFPYLALPLYWYMHLRK